MGVYEESVEWLRLLFSCTASASFSSLVSLRVRIMLEWVYEVGVRGEVYEGSVGWVYEVSVGWVYEVSVGWVYVGSVGWVYEVSVR